MFERYTEKARRVVFFARYEAAQFGDEMIGDAHLLLGLLREDKEIFQRVLRPPGETSSREAVLPIVEDLRRKVENAIGPPRSPQSTSPDLPLNNIAKRVLAYAAEEAEMMSHRHIGTEHLLLGMLREQGCVAAAVLQEARIEIVTARELIAASESTYKAPTGYIGSVAPWRDATFLGSTESGTRTGVLEFVRDGKVIASVLGLVVSSVPRVGERVVLKSKKGEENSYRVEDLMYVYESFPPDMVVAPHRLTKVVIRLDRQ